MKYGKFIIYGFLVVLGLTTGILLVWIYAPAQVLRINNGPVPVRPTTQKADELVFLIVNYCKTSSVTGSVRRSLVSRTVRIMLPLQTDNGPKTCQQVNVPVLIPKQATPDRYHLHIDAVYQVNP